MSKAVKEEFARFFENPSRESLRDLLRNNFGEQDNLDFKAAWPDFPVIGKHMLGMANSGGGCIVFGVGQNRADKTFDVNGLSSIVDKADLKNHIQKYIPGLLRYEVLDFMYEDSEYPKIINKKFQVIIVEDTPQYLPFVSQGAASLLRKAAIYVRRGTSTEEANYDELQSIINKRFELSYSASIDIDIEKHLSELRLLYSQISSVLVDDDENIEDLILSHHPKAYRNPHYPRESIDAFIKRMIDVKKRLIQSIIERKDNYSENAAINNSTPEAG